MADLFTRRQFFKSLAVAFTFFGLSRIATACSDNSSDGENGTPDCLNAGTLASISSNHGHSLTVSKEDVAAGLQKSYDIQGSAGHSHSVTLTAAHFLTLAENTSVIVTSTSGNSHSHTVTVSCASA